MSGGTRTARSVDFSGLGLSGPGQTRPTITLPAGAADSGANLTAAITLLGAAGGHIRFGAGVHTQTTTPALPPNRTGEVYIDGPGATVQFSGSCNRFVDFAKVADYDTCTGYRFGPITVDWNGQAVPATNQHVFAGNRVGGNWTTRLNFGRIVFEDGIVIKGVPTQATPALSGISIGLQQVDGATDTTLTCDDVSIGAVKFGGGNFAWNVLATATSNPRKTRSRIKRVVAKGWTWDSGVTPSNQAGNITAGGFQVGAYGQVDLAVISGGWSATGSLDVGGELDNCLLGIVENGQATDCYNSTVLFRNIVRPLDDAGNDRTAAQRYVLNGVTSRNVAYDPGTGNGQSKHITIGGNGLFTSTGDTTSASNQVLNATGAWMVGDGITGTGIPNGTEVTGVSGTTLTISNNASATNTGVTLTPIDPDIGTVVFGPGNGSHFATPLADPGLKTGLAIFAGAAKVRRITFDGVYTVSAPQMNTVPASGRHIVFVDLESYSAESRVEGRAPTFVLGGTIANVVSTLEFIRLNGVQVLWDLSSPHLDVRKLSGLTAGAHLLVIVALGYQGRVACKGHGVVRGVSATDGGGNTNVTGVMHGPNLTITAVNGNTANVYSIVDAYDMSQLASTGGRDVDLQAAHWGRVLVTGNCTRRSAATPANHPYVQTAADYTMTWSDRVVGVTSTSAARTITLLAASAVPKGTIVRVKDESGAAGTNNISVVRAGSDTIDGATTTPAISTNYGSKTLYSDGTSKWFTA